MRLAKFQPSSSRKRASACGHPEPSKPLDGKRSAVLRRPVSVLVVVYTDDGFALLLKRVNPTEMWQSVTGSLEPGEALAFLPEPTLELWIPGVVGCGVGSLVCVRRPADRRHYRLWSGPAILSLR